MWLTFGLNRETGKGLEEGKRKKNDKTSLIQEHDSPPGVRVLSIEGDPVWEEEWEDDEWADPGTDDDEEDDDEDEEDGDENDL